MSLSDSSEEAEAQLKFRLLTNFLFFMQTFFPLVTGRDFIMSAPTGRESHFITISKELTLAAQLQSLSVLCNVPPGSGKSTICAFFVAWTMARYQNSQYLYISYGKTLATKHTEFTRRIIQNHFYKSVFGITVRSDSKAKDHFQTDQGASVKAFGSSGAITGQDAGLPNLDHFSGAIILDDMHKPDEVHSSTIRQAVIDNYRETILQRPRGPNVPIIFIGQRLHEDDLPAYMLSGKDERTWKPIILKGIDDKGHALYPEVNSLASLLEKQDKNPYVFASQYQQDPIPAGGALYKDNNFLRLLEEPDFICTFITADTAETAKNYNDSSCFSFWGLYEVLEGEQKTGRMALHWIDCVEIRVEPKDLKNEFLSFYYDCMRHKTKPLIAAIEKKSTGTTLISILQDLRGLEIREIKRTAASGSKSTRYLEMQPFIAGKLVTFTEGAKHVKMCVDHMLKITANDTHRWDDICDTCFDAVKLGLIDDTINFSNAYTPNFIPRAARGMFI